MASAEALSEFDGRLSKLPSIDNVAVGKIYSEENLVAVLPNLPGKSGSLRVIYSSMADGLNSINTVNALDLFGEELVAEAVGDAHPTIQLLKQAFDRKLPLIRASFIKTACGGVLEDIANGKADIEQKVEAMVLMSKGIIRGAEKIYNLDGEGIWEPQQYAFDTIKNGLFTAFDIGRMNSGGSFRVYDKIPMWDQDPRQFSTRGVRADVLPEEEFLRENKEGTRVTVPARFTAYIGPKTVVMQTCTLINVGAYIEGEESMIEGRVSSLAQLGKGVKLGGGSGLVGVLSPDGSMPTILEDNVQLFAMCEGEGIIEEGAVLGSGTVMGGGKRIFDRRTGDYLPKRTIKNSEGTELSFPYIPANRVAVPGVVIPNSAEALSEKGMKDQKYISLTESIILLEKDASDVDLAQIEKNRVLYQR